MDRKKNPFPEKNILSPLEDIVVSRNDADLSFDSVVGHIEDIIIDPEFYKLQNGYLEKFYKYFEDNEENKLECMTMFQEYTESLECHLQEELQKKIPAFSMENFLLQLKQRKDTLDGEVFELLLSFTDFLAFKELVLDYKASKQGQVDLSPGLTITSLKQ